MKIGLDTEYKNEKWKTYLDPIDSWTAADNLRTDRIQGIILGMKLDEQEHLFKLVENPPKGSKIEAAKNFGIDLTLNLRSLRLSPAERVQEMENALNFSEQLRAAMLRSNA